MTTASASSFISKKASQIEGSITMAISAKAKQMKKDGIKVLSFSAGEPDFDTPDFIKDAGINAIKSGKNFYTDASGIPELKEAICRQLKDDVNLDYTVKNIIISCGAKHSIYNVLLAVINPGDEVIIPGPYWVSYPYQVKLADGVPVYIETNDATEFKITPAQLEAAITPRTKVVVLNSPSNPTGSVYTKDELAALGDVIVKHNILVISDEIYGKLVYGADHVSIASLSEELKALTLVVNGASKAYSMTGWRIGYTAGPAEIIGAMSKIQSHSTSNPTTSAQWAALTAFNSDNSAVNTMREAFDGRRQYMVETLQSMPGISCNSPNGAFYAFPNVSAFFGKRTANGTLITGSLDFCAAMLEETHVACVPGVAFGSDNNIRLSYATGMDEIKQGLSRIKEWLTTLK